MNKLTLSHFEQGGFSEQSLRFREAICPPNFGFKILLIV